MTSSANEPLKLRDAPARVGRGLLQIFSGKKGFGEGPLGDPRLNRFGLHPFRIAGSELCVRARQAQLGLVTPSGAFDSAVRDVLRDGVAVVPEFLPADAFARLRSEVRARVDEIAERHPMPENPEHRGFGFKRPFEGGFDRFDGSTLNRFIHIDPERLPVSAAALRDRRLVRICRMASGFRHAPERFHIYVTRQGPRSNHDIQQDFHRDTFHSTIKLWLFLDDAPMEAGPFCYAPGSHRLTPPRWRWEYMRAVRASAPGNPRRGGAFRLDGPDLAALGVDPPRPFPVAANTLVIADVRGIHCRAPGGEGQERLSLYASLRKWPFAPIPI